MVTSTLTALALKCARHDRYKGKIVDGIVILKQTIGMIGTCMNMHEDCFIGVYEKPIWLTQDSVKTANKKKDFRC